MRKLSNFIVEKRYLVLILFIILSILSLIVSSKVKINNDIKEYLPEDSTTKKGINIMKDEFSELNSSELYVMFKGLSELEKTNFKEELEKIKYVSSIEYDNTSKHNKKDYTLYLLKVDKKADSKEASYVYKYVKDNYKDYDVYLSGSIETNNKEIVKKWILISAVIFATIILILMCNSYIEPFMFLFVILLAIFVNKGTNIMFGSVSSITNAISAILQLALSMDYSIILMNRYTQEKQKNKNKVKAMKEALYNAFSSITSSSITTVVGLLALVFMSFTIGRDLGFVLAKGVFLSLISIFLCLPALILMLDNLITKTKKKSINFKLDKLSNYAYKTRYINLILFVLIFIFGFIFKDNLSYLYTGTEQDEVIKVFNPNNQIAVIYKNEYEKDIAEFCSNVDDKKVYETLCYSNTINEELKYDELNDKLDSLNASADIDDYIIKIIYYYSVNENINNKMTLSEFINFIESTIYDNKDLKDKIDKDTKNNIKRLDNFINKDKINKKRSISDTAKLLEYDEDMIKKLYILHNRKNVNIKLSVNELLNFINKEVINNKDYNKNIDSNTKKNINDIKVFTNKEAILKKYNKEELSKIFNIDQSSVEKLLILYNMKDMNLKLSIKDFVIGVDKFKSYITTDTSQITSLLVYINNENNFVNTKVPKSVLKTFIPGSDELVDMVYMYSGLDETVTMSLNEFINITLNNFSSYLDKDVLYKLNIINKVINDNNLYTYKEMSNIFNISNDNTLMVYSLIDYKMKDDIKLNMLEFVNLILNNKDNTLVKSKLDKNTLSKLEMVKGIMESVINNSKYTYKDMSNLLNMDKKSLSLLYSLYDINHVNKNYKISIKTLIKFIINDCLSDSEYKTYFSNESIKKIKTISNIIDDSLNNKKLSNDEVNKYFSKLDNSNNKKVIDLVYIYYGSINDYDDNLTFTLEKFIDYLNNKIVDNKIFNDFIDKEKRDTIKEKRQTIKDAKDLLVGSNYSRIIMNTNYKYESDDTFKFIDNINNSLKTKDKSIYVIGDSAMAHEMNQSFSSELNFITILTMIAIFIVVAVTFKSGIISAILVLIIECAVFITMTYLSITNDGYYFIAILIVQSILMGATIDYGIVYTNYYIESRKKRNILDSLNYAYNNSIHTILTSATILIIVTFIVGLFAELIASKICMAVSFGTLTSLILILFMLPGMLASLDKLFIKKKKLPRIE